MCALTIGEVLDAHEDGRDWPVFVSLDVMSRSHTKTNWSGSWSICGETVTDHDHGRCSLYLAHWIVQCLVGTPMWVVVCDALYLLFRSSIAQTKCIVDSAKTWYRKRGTRGLTGGVIEQGG